MSLNFSPLFQPYTLNNGIVIKNRLVVAPMTHYGSHADGSISDEERAFLRGRAADFGLFITAATLVSPNDDLMLITSGGVLIRTKVEQVRETGRTAAGVKLINLDEGTTLVSIEPVAESDDADDVDAAAVDVAEQDGSGGDDNAEA